MIPSNFSVEILAICDEFREFVMLRYKGLNIDTNYEHIYIANMKACEFFFSHHNYIHELNAEQTVVDLFHELSSHTTPTSTMKILLIQF